MWRAKRWWSDSSVLAVSAAPEQCSYFHPVVRISTPEGFSREARVWHSLCVLCSSARALTRKLHLKLFSDLLLSLQLYPCHWITQSYWTSERPAEGIQVPPCPSLSATPRSFSLPLTRVGVTFWCPLLYRVPGAVGAAFPSLSFPFRVTRG